VKLSRLSILLKILFRSVTLADALMSYSVLLLAEILRYAYQRALDTYRRAMSKVESGIYSRAYYESKTEHEISAKHGFWKKCWYIQDEKNFVQNFAHVEKRTS
jgi:hypothetical protein